MELDWIDQLFGCFIQVFGPQLIRKISYTFLSQDSHVNLKSQKSKDTEGEHSQNDDVTQVFDGFNHGTDNRFEACKQ